MFQSVRANKAFGMISNHVLQHIQEKCNLEPIRNLLRAVKERNVQAQSELILGGTKEESIENLSLALSRKYCSYLELYQLLNDAEENGHQHILLLCPDPEQIDSACLRSNVVAGSLFDRNVDEMFPRFEYPSSGYAWADFRHIGTSGDWIAKAYGRESVKVSLGMSTEEFGDGRIQEIREYDFKEIRTTSVARWRSESGILELRIDSSGLQNIEVLPRRREAMWGILEPVFTKDQFCGIDVDVLMQKLVFNRRSDENSKVYTISRVELTDPRSGLIKVLPFQSEAFDNEPGRQHTLEAMRAGSFLPSSVKVEWNPLAPQAPAAMNGSVTTVLEKTENGPELRMLKRVTSEVYEYIFNQLRIRLH